MTKRITALLMAWVLFLGLCSCEQGTSGQAADSAEQTTWQEQYDLGIRYLSEGNYEEAIIAFTAAIEIDPKQAPAYVGRGQAYTLSGETEENLVVAQADFETAIQLDETQPDAWLGLVDVFIRRGDYEQALQILQEALDKAGENQLIAEKLAEIEAFVNKDPVDSTNEGLPQLYGEVSNVHMGPPLENANDGSGQLGFEFAWDTESVPQELDSILATALIATWSPDGFSYDFIIEQSSFYRDLWKSEVPAWQDYPFSVEAFPVWEEDLGTTQQVLMYSINESWEPVGYIVVSIEIPSHI